jgi:hypothetical protein
MQTLGTTSFLRRILLLDAAISGAAGLVMGIGAGALEGWLGVPATLLRYAGWSLLPFAWLLVTLARRDALPRGAVVAVIVANAAWVVASVVVLIVGGFRPNVMGYVFVLGQAVAVAVLAEMEAMGLRSAS